MSEVFDGESFYTVYPIGDFAGELPKDFVFYDDALLYGEENFGIRGKDFVIEAM